MAILFEWNKTDLSQFNTTPVYTPAGWTPTLTTAAYEWTAGGQAIEFTSTGGAPSSYQGHVIYLANDPLTTDSFTIHIECNHQASSQSFGFVHAGDTTGNLHCLIQMNGGQQYFNRINNGTAGTGVQPTGSGAMTTNGVRHVWSTVVRGDRVTAGPRYSREWYVTSNVFISGGRTILWSQEGLGAYAGSWSGLTGKRWGLAFGTNGILAPLGGASPIRIMSVAITDEIDALPY